MKISTPGPTPTTSPEISVPVNKFNMKTVGSSVFEYWVVYQGTFGTALTGKTFVQDH
jgi:hypothetical protein